MRTSLLICALGALCFGQHAFAQAAPKNVVVVDGQIAVSNLPPSQTVEGTVSVGNLPAVQDVRVLGGVDPIPVVDQTAPVGEPFFGSGEGVSTPRLRRAVAFIDIPDGKFLVLKNASVLMGAHANVVPRCQLSLGGHPQPRITHYFDLTVNRFPTFDNATVFGSEQWDDLPAVGTASFFCFYSREDGTDPTRDTILTVSWFGYLYDAPTP